MSLLFWAVLALVISGIAGAFGFSGVASGAKTVAKVLFGLFLALAVVLFVLLLLGTGVTAAVDG